MMGDTIDDMDMEIERKDNKRKFLETTIGLADSTVIEGMIRLGLNKISSKTKGDRIMDGLKSSPNIHKYINNWKTTKNKQKTGKKNKKTTNF